MSEAQTIPVTLDEVDQRVDRWLRGHFPQASLSQIQKWLRTGQVRVDGRRVKPGARLGAGQQVRVPPAAQETETARKKPVAERPSVSKEDAEALRTSVLYRDDQIIAINKPAGLAVQGGSRTYHHLDGMLDALTFDASERPRLVHRLDKDTSGVMLLARTSRAASDLAWAFRSKQARKLYWAIVVGYPNPLQGRISAPLIKMPGERGERVEADGEAGKDAVTYYRTADRAGRRASWLILEPTTGRTHQLRVHCAQILGKPILGDGKYGGADAFLPSEGLGRGLHLHARGIRVPYGKKGMLEVYAPLSPHMTKTMTFLGLDPQNNNCDFSDEID